jgi:hypothetical protein
VNKLFGFNIPALRRMSSERGTGGIRSICCGLLFAAIVFLAHPSFAQYSANIQGTVLDQNGAALNGAHLRLTNANTGVEASAVSNATGGYRFLSLAPGQYKLETQAAGFSKSSVAITLETNQTLDIPVKLSVASENVTVAVTTEAPVLDTAESRNEMTLEQSSVDTLPMAGRDLTTLVNMAPGVTRPRPNVRAALPGRLRTTSLRSSRWTRAPTVRAPWATCTLWTAWTLPALSAPACSTCSQILTPFRKSAFRSTPTPSIMAAPVPCRWR